MSIIQRVKPNLFVRNGSKLSPSGATFTELLCAVVGNGALFRFRSRGISMTPFIRDGDLITIAPLLGQKPRTGDVVAYIENQSRRTKVHRMVGKRGDFFLIKGDGLPELDGPVSLENIVGYVKKVERNGKVVRLGTGLAKPLIAFLSRKHPFLPLIIRIGNFVKLALSKVEM